MHQFTEVLIQPNHGRREAIVRWTVNRELSLANPVYHVYRSPDGAGDWALVNPVPTEDTELLDTGFSFPSRVSTPHYRVLAVLDGQPGPDSGPVGLFSRLTRREYGAVRRMVELEYLQIRHDGIPVLHFIPRTRGKIAEGWDEQTGQVSEVCVDSQAVDSYGLKYEGGYRAPLYTCVHWRDTGPTLKMDRDDGMGILDEFKVTARMLAFPRPEKGHLIVDPATDNRYIVGEVVKPWSFRGVYPVRYDAQLELARRESPVYRVPLPDLSELKRP